MAKLYIIEKRAVLAERTDVFYYGGPAKIGGHRWDSNPQGAVKLSFKDANTIIQHFRNIAQVLGNYHLTYSRQEAK
jgi:hypothetical protein